MNAARHEQVLGWLMRLVEHPSSAQDTKNRAEKLRAELDAQLAAEQVIAEALGLRQHGSGDW